MCYDSDGVKIEVKKFKMDKNKNGFDKNKRIYQTNNYILYITELFILRFS